MNKKIFYAKVVLAQIGGFFVSYYLVTNIFLGPIPVVRGDFKRRIAELPQKTGEAVKQLPERIKNIAVIAGRAVSSSTSQSSDVPPPWIFGGGPSPLPTPVAQGRPAPTTIAQISTALPGQPQPTSILELPTFAPLPSSSMPTNIPRLPTSTKPTLPQPTQNPTKQGTYSGNAELEKQTVDEINARRKKDGLTQLTINSALTQAARRQSTDMSDHNTCGHQGSDGSTPFTRAKDAGYTGQAYGETVFCAGRTALQAVDGWWSSPPHHAILTNAGIREIGLGWVGTNQTALVGK